MKDYYIRITQKVIDYINENKGNFEIDLPVLGDLWKVDKEVTYPNVCDGKPVVEVSREDEWMRLPKEIVKIEQDNSDSLQFSSILRLIDMIDIAQWNKYNGESYCNKLAVALDRLGYFKDARLVREHIKMKNGENIAMATQDKITKPKNKN